MNLLRKLTQFVTVCLLVVVCISMEANISHAKEYTLEEQGYGVKRGNNIYYSFNMDGVRMGIMRYNVKTGQKKEIFSWKLKGEGTNGFYNLVLKGKYIYATWDQFYGTGESDYKIYRIAIDGTSSKKLGNGSLVNIVENKIFYQPNDFWKNKKYYAMNMDGSGKRLVKSGDIKIVYMGVRDTAVSDYDSTSTSPIKGNVYSLEGKSIYKKNINTGEKSRIITCDTEIGISGFTVCGDYILVKGSKKVSGRKYINYDCAAYVVKNDGTEKRLLRQWQPAE